MIEELLSHYVPNQGGVIAIGAILAFVTFGDLGRLWSRRNALLAGLLSLAPVFVDLVGAKPGRMAFTFSVVYLLTAGFAVWAYRLSRAEPGPELVPTLGARSLRSLLIVALLLDALVVFGRAPDDAGIYTSLGAQRWVETGGLPYGDPKLKGPDSPAHGAAATYGPLLMLAHIPFQVVTGSFGNPPDADPMDPSYVRPPYLATQLTTFAFLLLGVYALCRVVTEMAGPAAGYGAALLYAASPYVLALGGKEYMLGGLTYISHIAPSAMTVFAFMHLARPALCGSLLAAAAGLLYYPAFLFPAWFGWRYWRKEGVVPFTVGFAATGAVIAGIVIGFTPTAEGENAVSLFLGSTLEHQEGAAGDQYGKIPFSFWGTHPELASIFHEPLFGSGSLFKPTFLAFISLCCVAAFLAKGRSPAQLAALTAMLAAAIQLWKSHAAGTYVEWYYPFLLIALVGATQSAAAAKPEPTAQERAAA